MFDTELVSADEAAVVAAIEEWAATEARAAARRIAAIGELVRRRCSDDEHAHWTCDSWDAAAAEVSAALGITHGRASGEMHLSQTLRHRLPDVAALFMAGRLSHRVCQAIAWRTDLVTDREALARIDGAVARAAVTNDPANKTTSAVVTISLQPRIHRYRMLVSPYYCCELARQSAGAPEMVPTRGAGYENSAQALAPTRGLLNKVFRDFAS